MIFFPEKLSGLSTFGRRVVLFRVFLYPKNDVFGKNGFVRGMAGDDFGSNVPQAVQIDPWNFQNFPVHGKNFPLQKSKHFCAKIGQNSLCA